MNTVLQAALGSILRWALAIGAGWIVKAGIWKDSEAETYVAAGSLALLALGWSLFQKYKSHIKFLTALDLPAGTTEQQVKETLKTGLMDKAGLWLVLGALALGLAGCVTSQRLETGGAYAATETSAARPELFIVDSTYDVAHAGLTTTFNFERNNRAALWAISHDIKHSLDRLRTKAGVIAIDFANARLAYEASPTPENLDTLNIILSRLQAANAAALVVIQAKGNQ